MSPTPRTSPTHARPVRETYSARGLLAYAAVVPVFVALLAAPTVMLMFTLGALTAVLLNTALGLL
ncbi:MAG: hypothetical protein J07HX64_01513 [halophilic archaeon J07HX64]|jgi:hypothetical protein|nr:MAG: hypothetical protein J07HX64_01513 [halophilic archaeon J07HX64]